MIKTFDTTDLDELTAAQEEWKIQHRPVGADRFEGCLISSRIEEIHVELESWSSAIELTGTSGSQGIGFVVPARDDGCYRSEGIDVAADRIDVFGPGSPVDAITSPRGSLIACTISTRGLGNRGDCPLAARLFERARGHQVVSSTCQATQDLRRWLMLLLDVSVQTPICVATRNLLFDETVLIVARALGSPDEDRNVRSPRRYQLARRARDYLLERQMNPPSIAEVCVQLNTSERTLHSAFGEMYGVSPKRFLKAQRLLATRRALKAATAGAQVSDIAFRLGFFDLGYFARDYRAMFGELPSATLRMAG